MKKLMIFITNFIEKKHLIYFRKQVIFYSSKKCIEFIFFNSNVFEIVGNQYTKTLDIDIQFCMLGVKIEKGLLKIVSTTLYSYCRKLNKYLEKRVYSN